MIAPPSAAAPVLTLPGIRHGFFGRRGGTSSGVYNSLNCGPGSRDQPAAVTENRARVARTLSAAHLLSLHQTHGIDVVMAREPWDTNNRPHADAMVTDRPGLALGTLAADCAPILFADAEAHVIGAAHAGWRGALAGVATATVGAMESLGARRERIRAAIGPTIGPRSYEVGAEFPAPFVAQGESHRRFFAAAPKPGKFLFDLPTLLLAQLKALGLAAAESIGHDTCAEPDRYFSYRRTTLAGGGDYGRNISAIVLEE